MRNFFDANILAYIYDSAEPEKCWIAIELLPKAHAVASTQVVGELSNVLSGKFHFSWSAIAEVISQVTAKVTIHTVSSSTIFKAIALAERYKYSYYDSLILASAIEPCCSVLYSEDFQHDQLIEGVRITDPFL